MFQSLPEMSKSPTHSRDAAQRPESASAASSAGFASEIAGAQSVVRVLRILKYLGAAPARGVGVSNLARELGLTQPTAHRMLSALVQEGFVSVHPTFKTYTLGREAYILGLAAESRYGIKAVAEAAIQRLAMQTGDTSFLSVRSGDEAVCLDRKTGDFPIKILTLEIGHRRPLGVGAGSLALLAYLPANEREALLARYPAIRQPHHPAPELLREDIAATLRNGYALNPGRIIAEMVGVGVPVLDRDKRVLAALSVAAIRSRLSGTRLQEVVAALHHEARQLAQELSGRRSS